MNALAIEKWMEGFMGTALDWIVSTGLSVLAVLVGAYIVTRFARAALGRLRKMIVAQAEKSGRAVDAGELSQRIETLGGLLQNIAFAAVWSIAGMIILKQMGIDIAPILAGAGVIGLAVGFGAQNLVRDVVSGFFIILENQVGVGDVAVVNGTGGLVESVGLRTIVLRDASGTVHVFPNGAISTLSNMTKDWSAMVFDIGVAYKEDTDNVAAVMMEVAEELKADEGYRDKILEPMEIMGVDSFGDSAVVIKARIKTKPIQQWGVGREYRRRLKKAFDAKGIEIPYPHMSLNWNAGSAPLEAMIQKAG